MEFNEHGYYLSDGQASEVWLNYNGNSYDFSKEKKNLWILQKDLKITLQHQAYNGSQITIPTGFETDFRTGTIKRNQKYWVPKFGIWFVIHDFLYRNQNVSVKRKLADHEQGIWMISYNVSKADRSIINSAVRAFGKKHWRFYKNGGEFPATRKRRRALARSIRFQSNHDTNTGLVT